MKVDVMKIKEIFEQQRKENLFSGVILIQENDEVVFKGAYGLANRSENIPNKINTKFGVASGCKLFTAVAICQLVERGFVSFDTPLKECLNITFPKFDPSVTIHHLLTHTSGIPDYFDEEVMDDFEALWQDTPMYNIRNPKDFLPMFQSKSMKFIPGKKFHYNNAGYILLGLIVENKTGMDFKEYVKTNILEPCEMKDSGYFYMDRLPQNTAYGYIEDESAGTWRTNIYSLPIVGGPDGGAFTTAPDLTKFWEALFEYKLLSKDMTKKMLTPHVEVANSRYYGYGVWIISKGNRVYEYYIMGKDPGASLISLVCPEKDVILTILSNTDDGAWGVIKEIRSVI